MFFSKWSNDMAYILGFIFADGNIYKSTLSFTLSIKDICILRYIKKCLKTKSPIQKLIRKTNKGSWTTCRLRIHSSEITKQLRDVYGIHPNKTKRAKIIFKMPLSFMGDFIRGFFDGDGWVCNRRNSVECGICCASKIFLTQLRQLCGNIGRIRERKKSRCIGATISLYCWEMNKTDSLKLRNIMYKSGHFFLKRKKDKFWNFYTQSDRWWTKKQINFLVNNKNKSQMWLSQKINKSIRAVNIKLWRIRHNKNNYSRYQINLS